MISKTRDSYKKHLLALIGGPLLKMVEAFFDLLIPLFMKAILDLSNNSMNGLDPYTSMNEITKLVAIIIKSCSSDSKPLTYALIGGMFILLMGIVGFITTMITQYIAATTAVKIGTTLRDCVYEKILSLSIKDREKISDDKLLTVLNSDTYQVQQGILHYIRLITRVPFIIIGALVISLILDWKIGLIFVAIIPVILIIIFVVMRKASHQYVSIQNKLDSLSTQVSDTLIGSKDIRAFSTQKKENKKYSESAKDYYNKAVNVSKTNALVNPLTFALISIATTALVLFAVLPNIENNTNVDAVLATTIITEISYLFQIFTAVVRFTDVIIILTKSAVSEKRIDQVLKIKPSITNGKSLLKNIAKGDEIIRFDNVSLSYDDGGNNVLSNISFSLNKSETLGIIGGTGCGKTTLVKMILRFFDANSGTVFYKGENIKDYLLDALRNEVAIVIQKASLFKGSIKSNMLMANKNASDNDIVKALQISDAYRFVSNYSDTINHNVEEGGKNFSGGQKQRLSIARSLLKKPEVLILDDSTSALDLLTDKKVRDNINISFPDMTKIIISQRVSTISSADKIIVLDKGKIIDCGTHDYLLNNCSLYKEIYDSQNKRGEL